MSIQVFSNAKAELKDTGSRSFLEDHFLRSFLHTHNQVVHPGTATMMASGRESLWVPKMRAKVQKVIKKCNVCKVLSTKPTRILSTSAFPGYGTQRSRPFEVTAVEFSRLFSYKLGEKEEGKWYVIIFTCTSSRAVHLEVASTQRADKFKNNFNALVTHQTRLASSSWIMPKCLRSQRLNQDCWEK